MAISVVPGSVAIDIVEHPFVNQPRVDVFHGTPFMYFTCRRIRIRGSCRLTGSTGENPGGWTLGFIQMKIIDTDWASYRGQTDTDGSSFLQFSRPPALPQGSCRDTINPGNIFVDNNPGHDRTIVAPHAHFPVNMTAEFADPPQRVNSLTYTNALTHQPNFIRETQIELHFCTVLSLLSPAGVFQHLKSVYWNVQWQGRFLPGNFGNLQAQWSIHAAPGNENRAHVSRIIDGPPTDTRFTSIMTAPGAPNCNLLTLNSHLHPNVQQSATWKDFDVTK